MKPRCLVSSLLVSLVTVLPTVRGEEPSATPKVVPQTRDEMKALLEGLKTRQPRLPLPPKPAVNADAGSGAGTPGRIVVNNGRMREYYLPANWQTPRTGQPSQPGQPAPEMNLDYAFKTRLFWIVSRVNNCHYCLGHQEHKLLTAGMVEDEIAALDSQWDHFSPSDQAALALARQMTLNPHLIRDTDIDALRPYFDERAIVEIVYTIASNNSTNRWTDSLGIPQDDQFRDHPLKLDTPTSDTYRAVPSKVAVVHAEPRGPLCSADEVIKKLEECRSRAPRVAFPTGGSSEPSENWVRMLSYYPETAAGQKKASQAVASEGRISPHLKAGIAWVTARENRAWYATAHALSRLEAMGLPREHVLQVETNLASSGLKPGDVLALQFARKLTSHPQDMTDADIAGLREHFSDHEVAEIVYVTCFSNWFDRFTETLQIPLEPVR